MRVLPWREPRARTAEERALRAAQLRWILGPVEGWPEDERVEWLERAAIMEFEGGLERIEAEREATEVVRALLLGRLS
jgi:hypothetical protein